MDYTNNVIQTSGNRSEVCSAAERCVVGPKQSQDQGIVCPRQLTAVDDNWKLHIVRT